MVKLGCVPGCIGRALEWHSRGKGFDPPHLHQREVLAEKQVLLFCLFFAKRDEGDRRRSGTERQSGGLS